MKKSHEAVFPHLHKALVACGTDARMQPVKLAIQKAISECNKVSKKRITRETALERFHNEGIRKNEEWQKSLAEGMKKLALNQLQEKENDQNPNDQES